MWIKFNYSSELRHIWYFLNILFPDNNKSLVSASFSSLVTSPCWLSSATDCESDKTMKNGFDTQTGGKKFIWKVPSLLPRISSRLSKARFFIGKFFVFRFFAKGITRGAVVLLRLRECKDGRGSEEVMPWDIFLSLPLSPQLIGTDNLNGGPRSRRRRRRMIIINRPWHGKSIYWMGT